MAKKRGRKPSGKVVLEVDHFNDDGTLGAEVQLPDIPLPGNGITPFMAYEIRRYLAECARRKIEGLKIYDPLPVQANFHASPARIRVLRGSNRCLAGDQMVFDPVNGQRLRVERIEGDFHVQAMDPATGQLQVKKACQPFVKGAGDLWEYTLSNGATIRTTRQHRVLSGAGTWIGIEDAYDCGVPLLICESPEQSSVCPPSRSRDVWESVGRAYATAGYRSGLGSPPDYRHSYGTDTDQRPGADCAFYSCHPRWFQIGGGSATATIVSAKRIGQGLIWDFTVEDWSNYQCAGLINANSGKTLAAAVEVARAACGLDPFNKYPKENGRYYCVGADQSHIGETMYRKLCMPGALKMIKDEQTREWRAYRPWEPADQARKAEAKQSAPLIPTRMIKDTAWESKRENIPSMIRLTNGWELVFYSSLGKPPQGSDIDGWWFDEEIIDERWYPEMVARILDRGGCGIWSATPQAGTDQLYDLHEQASKGRDDPDCHVREYICLMADNPHMTAADKSFFAEALSEEEASVRIGGDFAVNAYKVYPEFSLHVHGIEVTSGWYAPMDWTLYAVIDPGYQVCAVLFAAIPPPALGDYVYLYDELYLRNCNADQFAQNMAVKTRARQFQSFLIDPKGSTLTEIGTGKSVLSQYTEAMQRYGVKSVETGNGFRMGSENMDAGHLAVHSLLAVRGSGDTKLRVVIGRCPKLGEEFRLYHNKVVQGRVTDQPARKNNHLMDTLRYLAMANPRYVKPAVGKPPTSAVVKAFRAKQDRKRKAALDSMNHLGPGKGI